jgi:protein-S-isoprenylcysteine O-methyltransferase Ste14
MTLWGGLALGYHIASRLAYVVGVGVALSRQDREQIFTRRDGVEAGFRRFRRMASTVMNNDGVSFVILCILTRQTIHLPAMILLSIGVLLVLLGVSTKLWAAARLGYAAYYWHNFFAPGELVVPDPPGPYRYFKNPMYTVGNLHMYGVALVLGSLPGLIAAAFDQAAIMAFYRWVEKPHFEALSRSVPPATGAARAGGSAPV